MPPLTDLPKADPIVPKAARRMRVQLEDLTDEDVLKAILDSGHLDAEEHGVFTRTLQKLLARREVPASEKKRARERFSKMGLDPDDVAGRAWRGEAHVTVAPFDEGALGPKALKPPSRR